MNRFVSNWYYLEVDVFSPIEYLIFASLAFATVLPAVTSTILLLTTFPIFGIAAKSYLKLDLPQGRLTPLVILFSAAVILFLLGVFPDQFFAFVWIAPLVLLTSVQAAFGRETVFSPLARGDWRPLIVPALAALICGFFWEMWNYYSLAQWRYSIAYVDRWHIFAMPVLGYGGYLPFGIECWAIARMVLGPWGRIENITGFMPLE